MSPEISCQKQQESYDVGINTRRCSQGYTPSFVLAIISSVVHGFPLPTKTTSEWTLWVVAVSCAFHVAEEYFTGWQEWARQTLGIVMPTTRFLAANTIFVIAALLLARVGWRRPALSLIIPSVTLVNAIFFHILPTIVQGRVSPGV